MKGWVDCLESLMKSDIGAKAKMYHALNNHGILDKRSMWVVRSLIHKRNDVLRGYNLTDILVVQISLALYSSS